MSEEVVGILKDKEKMEKIKPFFSEEWHIKALYDRLVLGKTLQSIGEKYSMSTERVRQIEERFRENGEFIAELIKKI